MATANPRRAQSEQAVTNLGDVTEPKVLASTNGVPDIQPLADLPEGYKSLAERHADAKGFTLVGDQVVLHF